MDQNLDDLKFRLKDLRRENADHRWFIPQLSLCQAMSEDAIRKALQKAGTKPYQLDEIAERILTNGIKIFAILVLTDQAGYTSRFIEAGELQNQRLPFSLEVLDKQLSLPFAQDFYERQWELTAPTFCRGTINKSLNDRSVLPFTKDKRIGNGAFGTVYEIELDDCHQQPEGPFGNRLVRKELENIENHRIELENLSLLSHLRHPNILELLASYTYKDKHNLIFPLAEGGTLADLFVIDRQKTPFRFNGDFLIALAGLSSAIEHVHNFVERRIDLNLIGCHHDLRPKNILVSRGTLVLADFGLSRFKAPSESSGTVFKEGAGDYLAPECEDLDDNNFQKLVVRRSSDIWSFGCIIAEAATYMILGPDAVAEFKKKRSFTKHQWRFSLFHRGLREPNETVNDWLSELENKSSRTYRMLLELVRRMLSMDEKKRPKVKEVTARLQFIAQREVVHDVDELFVEVLTSSDSLDALIEQKRFEAWKYAVGMLDQEGVPDFHGDPGWEQASVFDSILDCLFQIQEHLKSISSQKQNTRHFIFLPLSRLNDRLGELLDGRLQEKSRTYFRASIFQSGNEGFLKKIQDDRKGLSLDKEIRMRATLKHMTGLAMQHYEMDTYKRQLDIKTATIGAQFGNHNVGRLEEGDLTRQVLVEWRWYGRQSADKIISHELFVRVEAIADLLSQDKPEEFRALDCRGFFHDPSRFAFGVVYEFPQPTKSGLGNPEPKTLQKLIAETAGSVKRHPALDDKFKIAYTLARSVLEFHLVGWLHKGLTSSNIAFFPTKGLLQDEWLEEPYIVGFNHSRPDEISAFTEGLAEANAGRYQHPAYLKASRGYCAEFDYYSLGIILLEIGLWRPLDEIIQKYTGSHEDVRDKLLKDRIPLLKQSMGRCYCEAVRVCVEGDFGLSELSAGHGGDAKSLHLSFERLVVSQLKKFST